MSKGGFPLETGDAGAGRGNPVATAIPAGDPRQQASSTAGAVVILGGCAASVSERHCASRRNVGGDSKRRRQERGRRHGGSVSRTEAWRAACRRHPARNAAVRAAGTGGERAGGHRAYRDERAARRLTLPVPPDSLPAADAKPPTEAPNGASWAADQAPPRSTAAEPTKNPHPVRYLSATRKGGGEQEKRGVGAPPCGTERATGPASGGTVPPCGEAAKKAAAKHINARNNVGQCASPCARNAGELETPA